MFTRWRGFSFKGAVTSERFRIYIFQVSTNSYPLKMYEWIGSISKSSCNHKIFEIFIFSPK